MEKTIIIDKKDENTEEQKVEEQQYKIPRSTVEMLEQTLQIA